MHTVPNEEQDVLIAALQLLTLVKHWKPLRPTWYVIVAAADGVGVGVGEAPGVQ